MNSTTMSQPMNENTRLAQHIEVMQDLFREITEIQKENKDVDKGINRVQEIILESSTVVENSISPSEMMIDARILHAGSSVVNMNVSSLNTNLTGFNESKYIRGIHNYIETSDQVVVVGKEWECLAPVTYRLFKKSHPVTFMIGSLELEPLPPKKNKERQKKAPEAEKLSLATVPQNKDDKPASESGDIYDHILKWLVRRYKKNDRKPISYFNFIVDPQDYWRSVENIFHFAFLVRDGSARMILTEKEPLIEPVVKTSDDKSTPKATTNYQFCFSLNMVEWQKCIEKFNIKKPLIPPFETPSSN